MTISLLCLLWLPTKRLRWLICGTFLYHSREGGWTPRFARPFNDWELEEILCLLNTIQGKRIFDGQDDLMILKETRDGRFLVKLLFKALVRSNDIVFPHKFIWHSWVLTKVGFFLLGKPLGGYSVNP